MGMMAIITFIVELNFLMTLAYYTRFIRFMNNPFISGDGTDGLLENSWGERLG
jgi:hypothetical protein